MASLLETIAQTQPHLASKSRYAVPESHRGPHRTLTATTAPLQQLILPLSSIPDLFPPRANTTTHTLTTSKPSTILSVPESQLHALLSSPLQTFPSPSRLPSTIYKPQRSKWSPSTEPKEPARYNPHLKRMRIPTSRKTPQHGPGHEA